MVYIFLMLLKYFRHFFCLIISLSIFTTSHATEFSNTQRIYLDLTKAEQTWIAENPVIKVAATPDWPPFEFLEKGLYKGLHADILRLAVSKLGLNIAPVFDKWSVLEKKLRKEELDLCPGLNASEKRKKYLVFTDPLSETSQVIITKETRKVTSINDLSGKVIAVEKGFANESYLRQHFPQTNLLVVDNTLDALKAVITGDADAYVGTHAVSFYLLKKHRFLDLVPTAFFEEALPSRYRIGVIKSKPLLRDILQKGLDAISDNEMKQLLEKWFGRSEIEPKVMLTNEEKTWIANHPIIRVGVDHFPPFEITDDSGNYKGLGAEYLNRIAKKTGLKFQILTGLTWSQIQEDVKSGLVDLIPVITPTSERSKSLLFTEAYLHNAQVVITLNEHPSVEGMADFKGKTMAVSEGYSEIEDLNRDFPTIKQRVVHNPLEELKMVVTGQVDACQGNQAVFNYYIRKHNLRDLKVAGPSDIGGSGFYVMGSRKDWPVLNSILRKGLKSIKESERIAISQKWNPASSSATNQSIELTPEEMVWLNDHPVVRVGSDSSRAPMEYVNRDGTYQGIVIDYLKIFEKKLGIRFEIVQKKPWDKLITMSQNMEIDMFSCITKTPERSNYLSFGTPYTTSPIVIFSRVDKPYIGDLVGLEGKKVAVRKAHAIQEILAKEHPRIPLVLVSNVHDALDMLNSGEVYAYVGNLLVTSYIISEHGHNLIKVSGKTPYEFPFSMASRNDWPMLVTILQKALDSINETKRNAIFQKWSSVSYEHSFDYSLIWKISVIACFLILILFFWNRMLQSKVKKKTAAFLLNEERLEALLQLNSIQDSTEKELTQYALDEAVLLTRSKGGYIHFYDEKTKDIRFNFWSWEVIKDCQLGVSEHFPLDKAGMWADSIRNKRPMIHNNYVKLPDKRELTDELFPIHRHMSVPVTIDKRIMAVAGVVNKGTPYDETDVRQLKLLMNDTWQIIQRKRTQKDLWLTKYSIEQSNYPFLWIQEDSRLFDANDAACRFIGYTHKELCTMRMGDFASDFSEETWPVFWEKLKANKSLMFESHYRRKNGDIFPVEISANHLEFEGQQHMFAYVSDISTRIQYENDQKNLEKQLQQAQKMEAIGTLSGGIAHDFNNILAGILGYSELAQMNIEEPEKATKDISQVIKGAERAAELVQQILTFSRQTEFKMIPFNIYFEVNEALKLLRSTIPSNIEMKKNLVSKSTILADPIRIHQVVMNLCTNAYHAMQKTGGCLTVSLSDIEIIKPKYIGSKKILSGKFILLEVGDTGMGMDKATLAKAFEPYFSTKKIGQGTGLGLALVHAIVEEHDGILEVFSQPEKGTKFSIYFPIVKQKKANKALDTKKDFEVKGNENIMIVDDEESIRQVYREFLQSNGYGVDLYNNGADALKSFKKDPSKFDLIITDIAMPGLTGDKLANEVLKVEPNMPIILCTGFSEDMTKDKVKKLGVKKFVQKPISNQDLILLVREILNENLSHNIEL